MVKHRQVQRLGKLPSEVVPAHTWRTRPDSFAEVWAEVSEQLEAAPGLQAKTLWEWLQRKYPGRFCIWRPARASRLWMTPYACCLLKNVP